MISLKEKGLLSKWASTTLKSRVVSQNELKRTLKTGMTALATHRHQPTLPDNCRAELELDDLFGLKGVSVDLKALTLAAFGASAFFGVGGSIIGGETGGILFPPPTPPPPPAAGRFLQAGGTPP